MKRPLAVLIAERGSLTPVEIVTAARDTLPVLFVLDEGAEGPDADRLRLVAEALAPTLYADFADVDGSAAAIADAGATAVTTFTDRLCPLAARIRRRLRPTGGHELWHHKDEQRRRLVAAGVSRVRSTVLEDPEQARTLLAHWSSGVVVKPVNGVASAHTWLLRSPEDVDEFTSALGHRDGTLRLFAEEFIAGFPRETPRLADYVSVEVIRPATGTAPRLAFVTDRAPPAVPCRETGLMWPTSLPEATVARLVATANDALDVLPAGPGSYHVEIKPGPDRDEIIEVNGRLGGFVARAAAYGADLDVARLALDVAAGSPEAERLTIAWRRCVAVLLFPAPQAARRISRAPDRRILSRRPGVLAVDQVRGEGEPCSWQRGTDDAVATLWLTGDDHRELWDRFLDLADYLHTTFAFVDDQGKPVADEGWLKALRGPDA
ncbi:hypothetical protein Aph01nite_61630 [Acrocarpospora phusangensis]|uniref:ATP-grasp domain-containing protein n=2 Tax=Acrocarpospora phusangensis TaxID=1070424 RepID=A0A919QHT4_9ACTN|nr:hypothetical protein Aph01nite_61630 [Acrocarpospora phusangensis]